MDGAQTFFAMCQLLTGLITALMMHADDNALLIRVPRDCVKKREMGINVNISRQPAQRSFLAMSLKERLDWMGRGVEQLEKENTVPIPGFKSIKITSQLIVLAIILRTLCMMA